MTYTVTLIPGDGTGPELAAALETVIAATGVPIVWEVHDAGLDVMEEYGTPLPAARARLHPPHQGGDQGSDHDAGRQGLPQRQRGAAQGARPVRLPASRPRR